MSTKIILIAGKAQHGKDTVAKILKEELEKGGNKVLITHFAALLKFICKEYFQWNGEKDEKGRQLLQYVGTDCIRKKRPHFWVDFVMELISFFDKEWDYIIIPDTRFKNEISANFKGNLVRTVKVERLNFESPLTPQQQLHPSETDLDDFNYFDFIIRAESGEENLRKEVVSEVLYDLIASF